MNTHTTTDQTHLTCTATRADGFPCRAWAVRGSDPPRCAPHGGGSAPVGAPPGNQNALKHGFYARTHSPALAGQDRQDSAIAKRCVTHLRVQRYIDEHKHHLSVPELVSLCGLYTQNFSRLTRLVQAHYGAEASSKDDVKARLAAILAPFLRHHPARAEDPS